MADFEELIRAGERNAPDVKEIRRNWLWNVTEEQIIRLCNALQREIQKFAPWIFSDLSTYRFQEIADLFWVNTAIEKATFFA